MDHSACFLAGDLALYVTGGARVPPRPSWKDHELVDWIMAKRVADTCWEMYATSPTKLAASSVRFWYAETLSVQSMLSWMATTLDTTESETIALSTMTGEEVAPQQEMAGMTFGLLKRAITVPGTAEWGTTPSMYTNNAAVSSSTVAPSSSSTSTSPNTISWPSTWIPSGSRSGVSQRNNADMAPVSTAKSTSLRPELLASLFVLWRLSGDNTYRERGWEIFEAMEEYCKTSQGAYTGLVDVSMMPPVQANRMESSLFGATFKYLYLLMSDEEVLPLDRYVFGMAGHAFPVFEPPSEWLM